MQPQLDIFKLKMEVLKLLSQKSPQNKLNLLRNPPGDLESHLNITFTNQERALAARAIEELKDASLIRSTYQDYSSSLENWLEITDNGKQALERQALDDLDEALIKIQPKLRDLRYGCASALGSGQPDSLRQAAHSARELLRQTLSNLAPDEEVLREIDIKSKKDITRKIRIRYAMKKWRGAISTSDVNLVEPICSIIDSLYDKLSAEAHKDVQHERRDINDLIEATQLVLRRLLL